MKVIFVTYKCNNNCRFCYWPYNKKIENPMSFKQIQNIIISAFKEGEKYIELHGGEATIHPDFFQIYNFIKGLGMKISLVSNCRIFSRKKFVENVCNPKLLLGVLTSCHSHNPKIHEWLTRTEGSFNQTIMGIKNLLEYKIPLTVNIVILKQNVNELDKWVEFMAKIRVSKIRFSFPETEGILLKNKELIPSLNLVRQGLQKAVTTAKNLGMEFEFEKGPICLASKYSNKFLYQEFHKNQNIKPSKCKKCAFNERCVGININYKNLYKNYEDELTPLTLPELFNL